MIGGSNNPMAMADQERTPYMAMSQSSSGQMMIQGQYPLPMNCVFNGMVMMDSDDYKMAQNSWGVTKNFNDCHLQYQNQAGQAHMLNFMHALTPKLTLGLNLTHIVRNRLSRITFLCSRKTGSTSLPTSELTSGTCISSSSKLCRLVLRNWSWEFKASMESVLIHMPN